METVTAGIREFVRSEAAGLQQSPEHDRKIVAEHIPSLIQRVSAQGGQEIDRLISDMKILRERLHDEGERVQREIAEYVTLSQRARQWTDIIAKSLRHCTRPDAPGPSLEPATHSER
jgi:hypothetical protein